MKKTTILLLSVLIGMTALADIPNGYYANAVGKKDEALMTALEGIINAHIECSYASFWNSFDYTDVGSDGYYIDMYSTCKYNHTADHTAGASYVGEGINREHSFPKSWFNSMTPAYTDQHMLIPTDAYVNQRRNNYPYGISANGITYTNDVLGVTMLGKLGQSTYDGYTATVFEPDDEYKGDFARIYFYMVTCYKSSVNSWTGSDQLDKANGYKAFSDWSIQMLMEWHRADPVSDKEIARNEVIYSNQEIGQGNRNPYVDHPELAEYIWGTKQNTVWTENGNIDDQINKIQPTMLEADTAAVKGTAFRADWTNGGDVSSYTLKVTRIETGDDAPVLMLSEGFSNVNVYTEGYNDIGSTLDTYTDNAGWTGYKLYTAVGNGLKFGTSSTAGYIISPELALGNTISVNFNAKNWINGKGVSDNSSVIVSCGDVTSTIQLTDNPTDYTVVLTGCRDHQVKLSGTGGNRRFYIYNINIYNGDITAKYNAPRRKIAEEGDSTQRTVSGITDTCYTVNALAEGTFEYLVKAIYLDGSESDWSNIQHVTLTGISSMLIGDVNNDGEINVTDVTTLISIILDDNPDDYELLRIDINQDNEVNVADVTTLINIILNRS